MVEPLCAALHELASRLPRSEFPPAERHVPTNGVYVVFERGEQAHGGDRIVRIGSHTGKGNLLARLREHVTQNKDRSIFRKNIGRALLAKGRDPFLEDWNRDLTSHAARERYAGRIDWAKQGQVEEDVTRYIQASFSFCVLGTADADAALDLERRCIATVARCSECHSSPEWLGRHSPVTAIRESGLWQVQHLRGEALTPEAMNELKRYVPRAT
jgi:hypothetical protein